MEQQGQLAVSDMVDSLTGWWELAGVDACVGEDAVHWLELDARPEQAERVATLKPEEKQSAPAARAIDWPADIDSLRRIIAESSPLPGNNFGSKTAVSAGPAQSDVMVVSDLPDQDELADAMLGSGRSGALLTRMLAAIGIPLADCYWTALATTIPPTGELADEALPQLGEFVRHQIGLVGPKSIILLGSATCRALLGEELMTARARLGNLNHDGRNIPVLTTFHPRTLIARPAIRAQAWKDLQMFAKRADL